MSEDEEKKICDEIMNSNEYLRINKNYLHLILSSSKNPKINCEIYKI